MATVKYARVSMCNLQDYKVRLYSRSKDPAIVDAIRTTFRNWLESYNDHQSGSSALQLCTPMKPQSSYWLDGVLPAAAATGGGGGSRAVGLVSNRGAIAAGGGRSIEPAAAVAAGELGQPSQGSGGEEGVSQPSRKRQRSLAREFSSIAEGDAEGEQE